MDLQCCRCGSTFVVPVRNGAKPSFCSGKCRSEHRREYYRTWVSENRSYVLSEMAARRQRFKDLNPDYFREYYRKNSEQRKDARRQFYASNSEAQKRVAREYADRNPDLIRRLGRKSQANRRARLVELFVEAVDPVVVFNRDNGICGICGETVGEAAWDIDHVIPLSKGGEHSYANVQLAHASCNRSKGARLPEQRCG